MLLQNLIWNFVVLTFLLMDTEANGDYSCQPWNCLDILRRNGDQCLESGVFQIYPKNKSLTVYCDMITDGGGWTVFQKRIDGSVNFTRSYKEYEDGFGHAAEGEFWLGNEVLHLLTSSGTHSLMAIMEDFDGGKKYAKYYRFFVDCKRNGYQVTVLGYTGDAGDGFARMNGSKFSTYDFDQDRYSGHCAGMYKGGWWYDYCHNTNPNGLYLNGPNNKYATGVCWRFWRGYYYSLKTMTLMFR